jgi:tape measure domain-containing protein
MTQSVDKRIVEMQFENSKFEANVGTSLSTIDKLKKSLKFDEAHKGFADINSAASKVTLSSISGAADQVANRFSAMGIVAITTLVNIANSAFEAGARIVKALTIEPVKAGLEEYETKLNSVQTILANTQKEGTNLKQVTDALNTLNEYSDKTIYNFQQMTRNVGTFTAAGVTLDSSVAAIKGIANLAAISGSNADQASTAMYQLSQALSTGTVKLMDWNSVVNAGMGGQVFQDAIKETARVHGVAIDQIIEEEGSFRDSLQRGWFTSEILTETLQKFTGDLNADQLKTMGYTEEQIKGILKMGQTASDAATKVKTFTQLFSTLKEAAQSGWAQTWEIIIGDFEEAKAFLTDLNNVFGGIIGSAADARNTLLKGWKDLGGRTLLIQSFKNVLDGVMSVVKSLQGAFREFFPPMTAQRLIEITRGFATFTEKFKMAAEGSDTLKRIFRGFFALLDIGRQIIVAVVKSLLGLTGSFGSVGSSVAGFLANLGDFIVKVRNSGQVTEVLEKALLTIKRILDPVAKGLGTVFGAVSGGFASLKKLDFKSQVDAFKGFADSVSPLGKVVNLIGKLGTFLSTFVKKIGPMFVDFIGRAADFLSTFVDKATTAIDKIDPKNFMAIISGGIFATILLEIKKFIHKGGAILESIAGIFDGVKDSLMVWQTSLKADILLKIAGAIGIIALSLLALSTIDEKKLTNALIAITASFGELVAALLILTKQNVLFGNIVTVTAGLIGISTAMLIFSAAAKRFQDIDLKTLFSMALALGIMGLAVKAMPKKVVEAGLELLIIAEALLVLGKALKQLGGMSLEQIGTAVVAIAGSLLVLSVGLTAMTGTTGGSLALFVAAAALLMLAPALKALGSLSWEAIGKGILIIASVLTVLGIAGALLTPIVPSLLGLAVAIGLIGVAALAAGVGMAAFSTGLAALAAIGAVGIGTLTLLITGLLTLLPMFATQLGKALTAFLVSIAENSVEIQQAMLKMIFMMLDSFNQAVPKMAQTIFMFIQEMLKTLNQRLPAIIKSGSEIVLTFLKGVRDNIPKIVPIAYDIVIAYINAVRTKLPALAQAGFDLIIGFVNAMADASEKNIPKLMQALNHLGLSIVKGVVNGILAGRANAINEIKNLAFKILETFKNALGIHSPSDAFFDESRFIPEGVAKSIKAYAGIAYSQIKEFGKGMVSNFSSVISEVSDSINSEMNFSPTIRPVVDLSEIRAGGTAMDALFARKSLNLGVATNKAAGITTGVDTNTIPGTAPTQGANIQFTQNNYSPKELSRIDIYRQTRNQLLQTKGLIGA